MKRIALYTLGALLSFATLSHAEENEGVVDIFSIADAKEESFEKEFSFSEDIKILPPEEAVQVSANVVEQTDHFLKNTKAPSIILEQIPTEKKAVPEQIRKAAFSKDFEKVKVESENNESLAIQVEKEMLENEPLAKDAAKSAGSLNAVEISLAQVFKGAPIIYSLLLALSIAAFGIWIYTLLTIRSTENLPEQLYKDLTVKLMSNHFTEALHLCQKEEHFFCKMVAAGILSRKQGLGIMMEMMKAEGKRSTVGFWQRLNLLNDIALIAPMLGLLGTVMGMFYAFYDLHRSAESISILFDGLGISVGTTIAGIMVAIIAMIFHSTAKYRLVKALSNLENEAQHISSYIETKGPSYIEG